MLIILAPAVHPVPDKRKFWKVWLGKGWRHDRLQLLCIVCLISLKLPELSGHIEVRLSELQKVGYGDPQEKVDKTWILTHNCNQMVKTLVFQKKKKHQLCDIFYLIWVQLLRCLWVASFPFDLWSCLEVTLIWARGQGPIILQFHFPRNGPN